MQKDLFSAAPVFLGNQFPAVLVIVSYDNGFRFWYGGLYRLKDAVERRGHLGTVEVFREFFLGVGGVFDVDGIGAGVNQLVAFRSNA